VAVGGRSERVCRGVGHLECWSYLHRMDILLHEYLTVSCPMPLNDAIADVRLACVMYGSTHHAVH